ncbi:hypothetical protein HMPREF0372_00057 [Flavonifractor plautii ATCC 29863]|uniref:Uncharacterized protein n=1 Tax=Flavonifractor plautii ATCC 29863 TaxID=411475 RepID=G9YKP6_FLAPL|nr:hypothetical protein HMPREF0372_00057 [Flavonifractor plautii ATCC 29863]
MQLSHTSCIRLRNVPTYGETFSLFNSSAIIPAFSSRIPRISTGSVSSGDGCSIRANSVRWLN